MNKQARCLAVLALWLLAAVVAHAGTVTYVYTDLQGTPLMETDAQGHITARFEYTPYGVAVTSMGAAPDGPGYTGHVNDPETGLVYMQARYYDPVGRMLSVDPVGPTPGNVYSFNRYAYASNNPVVNIDPDGMQAKGPKDMEICDGPVPCDVDTRGGDYGSSSTSLDDLVDKVFINYSYDGNGQASPTSAPFPGDTRTALIYILASPFGPALATESLEKKERIGLMQIPEGNKPDFLHDPGSGLVIYTLKIAEYKKLFIANPAKFQEVRDETLDVALLHEIAHTQIGSKAFGIMYSPKFLQSNEFELIRKAENPYRAFYGIPLRTTSNGIEIPKN